MERYSVAWIEGWEYFSIFLYIFISYIPYIINSSRIFLSWFLFPNLSVCMIKMWHYLKTRLWVYTYILARFSLCTQYRWINLPYWKVWHMHAPKNLLEMHMKFCFKCTLKIIGCAPKNVCKMETFSKKIAKHRYYKMTACVILRLLNLALHLQDLVKNCHTLQWPQYG